HFTYTVRTPVAATVAHTPVPIDLLTRDTFVEVRLQVKEDGTLDLMFDGQMIYTNLALPGYTPLTGARFALGARRGGAFETQEVDDFALTLTGDGPVGPVNYDFANGVPAGSVLHGPASVTNGFLQLTPAQPSQLGAWFLPDFAASNTVFGFTATFKVRMGFGS